MASTSNVIESAPLVKQSKKHAETLNRAREADISTCIGEGTKAKLEVAVIQDDEGAEILEYSYVWTGNNGQQSKCSFLQGSDAVLLPPDGCSRSQLSAIIFNSVQLKGSNLGKARFKIKDSGESGEVGNAAVGHRLISAYLLQSGLTTEEDVAAAFGIVKPSRHRNATQIARAQPVSRTAEQRQRAKHDAWHEMACSSLAHHPDWYEVCSEISGEGQRAHKVIKLSTAADCSGFGLAKYTALRKRRWKLCAGCPGIFVDLKRFERHRCAAPADAAAQESSEPAAEAVLAPAAEAVPAPASEPAPAPILGPAMAQAVTLPGGLYVQTVVPQEDQEEGASTPSGSRRSAALHSLDNDGGALAGCGAPSTPVCDGSGPDVEDIAPLAEEALRDRDEPANPRGPGLRIAQVAEPILYSHSELSWVTADGKQEIGSLVPKCPVALASDDSCTPCRVIRSGTDSRHGIIGLGYPERVSGVPRFRCREHKRNFSLLTPTVYEALPDGAVVQPELVVLTEDTIFRKEAWRVLGMKAWDSGGDFAKVALATAQQAQNTYNSWLLLYTSWLRLHAPEDQRAEIAAEISRWGATRSVLPLDFSDSSAPAAQSEPIAGEAAAPPAMATQQDNTEEDVLAEGAHSDTHTPRSLRKATTIAQRLRWLLSRISLSRLNGGIGRSVVQKLAEHWWSCEGSELCSDALREVLEQQGARASGDHTYGVVRNLAAYDEEGKPHVLRASLFTVMGQGFVLGCQVVPDDTHEGVDSLLKEIWISQKCIDLPAFYSTDNVAKDRYLVADSFADIRRARQLLGLTTEPITEIHQDVFHARERVARTLHKGHPDYYGALSGLRKVFGRLIARAPARKNEGRPQLPIQATQEGPYESLQAFDKELSGWEAFWSILRRLPDESLETGILRLAKTLSVHPALLQDAATVELSISAEDEAADISEPRPGGSRIGRLPNVRYMSSGAEHLQQHCRFTALSSASAPLEVPQRTPAWHAQRAGSVTASTAAACLGLKSSVTLKDMAASGFKVYPRREDNELGFRVAIMLAAQHGHQPPAEAPPKPFSRIAMAMGVEKEPDVLLSYVQHMDTIMPDCWKLRECGGKLLSALPSSVQALAPALAELPPVMASCDGIVYNSLTGEMLKAVEAKHRCPFVPSARQAFYFKGNRMLALEDVPLEYFSQCQMQMLVQDLPHCDLISYGLSGSRVFSIPRDEQWLALALHLLAHLQKEYIQADKVPEADMYSREVPQLYSAFIIRTKHCMAELQGKPRLDVPSSVDKSACRMFLDDLPSSHQQRIEVEELLGARPNEPAQAMPASPCPAELEDVAAEQQNDSPAPAEHEDSQAQGAGMSQAGIQESADAYEQQAMEAEPAGRPRRTLKRPQKVLEGLELPSQQDQQEPPQRRQNKKQRKTVEQDVAQPGKLAAEADKSEAPQAVPSQSGIVTKAVREAVERIKTPVAHRFNQSVRRSKQAAMEPKRKGPRPHQPREQALRQEFARAYNSSSIDHTSHRKRHQQSMHKSYDLQSMRAIGFQLAKPRAQAGNDWSQQEINALESLSRLDQGEEAIHTVDPHYWLAHHGMLRSKSPRQVQNMLRYLENVYGA